MDLSTIKGAGTPVLANLHRFCKLHKLSFAQEPRFVPTAYISVMFCACLVCF